ncbi:Hypothetical predicted protein [Olea europaea subsp. europaea]|uniref:Uncharacterized protein n=1 Tax=Olea europaea subsp. europaea TaxID=158383 RepID=A0A8S0SY90_OLEEU|nr:Hypothetical predicted protein [Olea europaea subsp. europaea]
MNFINDLEKPIYVGCQVQGGWIEKNHVSPHGGVAQLSGEPEDDQIIIASIFTEDSSIYDLNIFIDVQKDCKECAERGCHWSVRKDGGYQLINGKWVKVADWTVDK